METNKLELKAVGSLTGEYIVEDYQRGYRWDDEVRYLLEDIYSAISKEQEDKIYCLQPIVVKAIGNGKFELIDGQQRLTTIYLIYKYIFEATNALPKFTIDYATRTGSKKFLETMDSEHKDDYIDFHYMYNAYDTIGKWFDEKTKDSDSARRKLAEILNQAFLNKVKIIWYEVDSNEKSEILFARLNIGRIPLTCAELVKAMFLSSVSEQDKHELSPKLSEIKQNKIAMQWDAIERELRDNSFWYFLTNKSDCDDTTRIALVLDLMAHKDKKEKDKLHTFLEFEKRKKNGENLESIWQDINQTFLLLKGWYRDNELYHRIGYLIAGAQKSLLDIYNMMFDENKNQRTKTQFRDELDKNIRETIETGNDRNYGDLVYTQDGDYKLISKLLLLFNVMTMNKFGDRFPFDKFKSAKWSLEHIHAQHSKGLTKVKEQQEWLKNHAQIIKRLGDCDALVCEMENAAKDDGLTGARFDEMYAKAVKRLSPEGESATKHNISNLALLAKNNNAALNNATFAVKRAKIIEMDSKGEYIPVCTKMVFLKYYTLNAENMYFWSEDDRNNYIEKINDLLFDRYLSERIVIDKEDEE